MLEGESEALEGDLGEGFGGGEEGEALAGGGLELVEGAKFVVEGKLVEIKERAGANVRVQGFEDEGGGGVEVAVYINDHGFVIAGGGRTGAGCPRRGR